MADFLSHLVGVRRLLSTLIVGLAIFGIACSPVYTWGYEHAAHPVATASYIRAVMARERGDYDLAIAYYEMALRPEDSEKVRAERDDVLYRKRALGEPSGRETGP